MHKPLAQARDKDIPASWVAVQRAARMARLQAARTNTSIIVMRDNKLMRIKAEKLRRQGVT